MKLKIICLFAVLVLSMNIQAAIVSLPLAADTFFSPKFTSPQGATSTVIMGKSGMGDTNRGCIQVSFTGIPTNAVVTSVTCGVFVTERAPNATNVVVTLRRLSRGWVESQVTWNTPWSIPGASAPVDFDPSIRGQCRVTNALVSALFPSTPEMVSDVQSWIADPSINFGWMLIGEEILESAIVKFASRENTTTNRRPVITVEYFIQPPAPVRPLLTIVPGSINQFRFSFNSETGRVYTVEYADKLSATSWVRLASITNSSGTNIVVSYPFTPTNRFHRVLVR